MTFSKYILTQVAGESFQVFEKGSGSSDFLYILVRKVQLRSVRALELLSLLCIFENPTNLHKRYQDIVPSDFLIEQLKDLVISHYSQFCSELMLLYSSHALLVGSPCNADIFSQRTQSVSPEDVRSRKFRIQFRANQYINTVVYRYRVCFSCLCFLC